jgi:hypothetical protein
MVAELARSRVIVPSLALTLVAVAPLTVAGLRTVLVVAFCVYPFFHLWHRLTRTRH